MVSVKDIVENIDCEEFVGNINAPINYPKPLATDNADDGALMWVNDKNIHLLDQVNYGTIICSAEFKLYRSGVNYIIVQNPRLAFKNILEKFFLPKSKTGIASTASIDASAKIGARVFIGNNVVIEENCTIGDDTSIGHNTVILAGTEIGNKVKIGNNNTIGGTGFGYEKEPDGAYSLIPHLGNVVIHDNVEVGNNTCIDRGVLGATTIRENAKIDNLVHIAHGVVIGKNSLIIANAMIGGSTSVGDNVWFAPSASVLNKMNIGDNAIVGMGAVVLKDVKDGETIVGNPGKPLSK
jgi:UDP-3-O-[3-hydroxymyristoyl] glucosamine N-acyltransferase